MIMSETITKIAPALLSAQRSMGDAKKDSKNPFFKSSYADLNAVREVAIPALNAVGITVLQPTVIVDGKNYVKTLLLHESGEYLGALTEIKNTKGDAQSEGSGISYARRYGLQSFLNIGAVDDDGESTMKRIESTKTQEVKKPSFNKNATSNIGQQNAVQTPNDNLTMKAQMATQTQENAKRTALTSTNNVSEVTAGDDW
jgi:hypothetical protein